MATLAIIVAILVELMVFAQMPALLVAPAITMAVLIYISRQQDAGPTIIYYMVAGLFYDMLSESNLELVYFIAFSLVGVVVLLARGNLVGETSRQRRMYYLSLAAISSIIFTVLPAAVVFTEVGYKFVVYSIFVQFVFIALSLGLMRLVESRG